MDYQTMIKHIMAICKKEYIDADRWAGRQSDEVIKLLKENNAFTAIEHIKAFLSTPNDQETIEPTFIKNQYASKGTEVLGTAIEWHKLKIEESMIKTMPDDILNDTILKLEEEKRRRS